jgi:hypothetical protein
MNINPAISAVVPGSFCQRAGKTPVKTLKNRRGTFDA